MTTINCIWTSCHFIRAFTRIFDREIDFTVLHYKCTKRKAPFHMTCNKGQFDVELMMDNLDNQLSNSMPLVSIWMLYKRME